LPPFYDDNYANSTYGRDAPSTVESLGVNDKITDWIKDTQMPSIDEECGSVISDNLTNEEMLDCIYGHGTATHARQVKSVGSASSGVRSEGSDELSQKDQTTLQQHKALNNGPNEGQASPDTEAASWKTLEISRPNSLLSYANKHGEDMGNPTAIDTPTTPAVGSSHAISFPRSRKFSPLMISRLPSVNDSVFTEGDYVDHRIASVSHSSSQSPDISFCVGKACLEHENSLNLSCYYTSHSASPASASSSTRKTTVIETAVTDLTPCNIPFHIMPNRETLATTLSENCVSSKETGNSRNFHHSNAAIVTLNNDSSKLCALFNVGQQSTLDTGEYFSHSEDLTCDVDTSISCVTLNTDQYENHMHSRADSPFQNYSYELERTTPAMEENCVTNDTVPSKQCAIDFTVYASKVLQDVTLQAPLSHNIQNIFVNPVKMSSELFSVTEGSNLPSHNQYSTTNASYVKCNSAAHQGTKNTGCVLQSSHVEDNGSDFVSNYTCQNVVTSTDYVKVSKNTDNYKCDDVISVSNQCDTGM